MRKTITRMIFLTLLVLELLLLWKIMNLPEPSSARSTIDIKLNSKSSIFSGKKINAEILYTLDCSGIKWSKGLYDFSETKRIEGITVYKTPNKDISAYQIVDTEDCEATTNHITSCRNNRCRFTNVNGHIIPSHSVKFAISSPDTNEIVITNAVNVNWSYYERYSVDIEKSNGELKEITTVTNRSIPDGISILVLFGSQIILMFTLKYLFSGIFTAQFSFRTAFIYLISSTLYVFVVFLYMFVPFSGDMSGLGVLIIHVVFINLVFSIIENIKVKKFTNTRSIFIVLLIIFSLFINAFVLLSINESRLRSIDPIFINLLQ